MDPSKILLRDEVARVVADLRGRTSRNARQNLILFRLACGCGLRCAEICGLEVRDFCVGGKYPHIRIRSEIAKRKKARRVPLWWDTGTRIDLLNWINGRRGRVLTQQRIISRGRPLHEHLAARRWKTAIGCLGPERVAQLSIHCGRYSFCTHSIMAGRTLMEVRDAAGHESIATTNVYLFTAETLNSSAKDLYQEAK